MHLVFVGLRWVWFNYCGLLPSVVVSFMMEDVFSFMVNVVVIIEVERCRCSFASESDGGWRVIDGICYSAGVG